MQQLAPGPRRLVHRRRHVRVAPMPYAAVRVGNTDDRGGCFTATVDFLDARSHRVERRTATEFVAARDNVTVQVDLSGPGAAALVDRWPAGRCATAG
ncbi:hypothetical protein ABZ733_01140 [Streptomyces longwoodensis]|uniref:hypothetical protein n=1 Tax=Streptomyces longwoodensis TaxID=68231 RepID=UPI0034036711